MAVLGLRFCARAFSSCGKWGPLFIAVRGPLITTASPVAEHRLQTRRLSNCDSRAQLLRGMWDPPRPGLEPVSPALAGGFSTTAPPGKPKHNILNFHFTFFLCYFRSMVFNLQLFGEFSRYLSLIDLQYIPLWSENILCMISILLNLLRCVLEPKTQAILVNVPCVLGKNAYSAIIRYSVLRKPLGPVDGQGYASLLYPYRFFCLLFYQSLKEKC